MRWTCIVENFVDNEKSGSVVFFERLYLGLFSLRNWVKEGDGLGWICKHVAYSSLKTPGTPFGGEGLLQRIQSSVKHSFQHLWRFLHTLYTSPE